jgi:quinol monooxygenase YgiN
MTKNTAKVALQVRLEAKPGKEKDLEKLLRDGVNLVKQEPGTNTWYATRLGNNTFGIFDTFADDAGRQAHLAGKLAAELMARVPELLARPPQIEQVEVLAQK